MPAYIIQPDEEYLRTSVMAVSDKIVAFQVISGIPRIDTLDVLTTAELEQIKSLVMSRSRIAEVSMESGPNLIKVSANEYILKASATMPEIRIVNQTDTWQEMMRVVTTPGFFSADSSRLFVRAIGEYKATGSGGEIRVVETQLSNANAVVLNQITLGDTLSSWTDFVFDCVPIRLGRNRYTIEARANTASDVALNGYSLSLLEIR